MGARYENAALSQGSHADEGMATLEGCNPQRDPITYCKQLILDDRFLIVGSQVGGDLSKIAAAVLEQYSHATLLDSGQKKF